MSNGTEQDMDMPVVVMASDLNKLLRTYIDRGRSTETVADGCDDAWNNLHARLKAVHACESCKDADARARANAERIEFVDAADPERGVLAFLKGQEP